MQLRKYSGKVSKCSGVVSKSSVAVISLRNTSKSSGRVSLCRVFAQHDTNTLPYKPVPRRMYTLAKTHDPIYRRILLEMHHRNIPNFWKALHFKHDGFHTSSREWVIKFDGLFGDSGHRGPYSPYKLCNHSLYIGIIIFLHMDNTNLQATIVRAPITLTCHWIQHLYISLQ